MRLICGGLCKFAGESDLSSTIKKQGSIVFLYLLSM